MAARNARAAEPRTARGRARPRGGANAARGSPWPCLAAGGTVLSVSTFVIHRASVTPLDLLYESLVPLALVVIMVVALRRHLLQTVVNRRSVVALVAVIAGSPSSVASASSAA